MSEPKTVDTAKLKAGLYQKVVDITKELGKVDADGKNTHSGYTYVSYENVNARLRSLLPQHKLAIVPSITDYSEREFVGERNITIRTIVRASFMLVDLETGYSEERVWVGADADVGNKSMGQAVTEAQKRFELKLFHISTKADADSDGKTTEIPASAPPVAPLDFIRQHKDLVEICHGMGQKDIEAIVRNEKFDYTRVKAALESLKGF